MTRRKPPRSARILNQWVDAYARQLEQPPVRVRNWVSHMILGGALERAGYDGSGRRFTIKGGVALEMRLRHLARATRDLDLILLAGESDPVAELEGALQRPYEGFTFRLRSEPEVMPNGAVRVEVALQYLGKAWGRFRSMLAGTRRMEPRWNWSKRFRSIPSGFMAPKSFRVSPFRTTSPRRSMG